MQVFQRIMSQIISKPMKLSIVIPTLGGKQLNDTILSILSSTQVVDEILLCIPKSNELMLDEKLHKSVQIIWTQHNGQVFQRCVGFSKARGDFVLQLDDDIILDKNCILKMMQFMTESKENASISPIYYDQLEAVEMRYNHNSFFRKCKYWLMNGSVGYVPGKISLTGIGFIFDFQNKEKRINEVDWLSGACVLHKKENLVLENYYPFNGKAYSEDLIHSSILRKNLVKLFVLQDAIAYQDLYLYDKVSLLELYKQYRANKYHTVLMTKNLTRLRLYYLVHLLNFIFLKIISKLKFFLDFSINKSIKIK